MPNYEKRIKETIETLKSGLFEREECLKLVLLSMFAGKSIFLYGPPGTAKSMIARRASLAFKITDNSQDESKESNNGFFAYLMNRFSTPEEIFGPIDIAELKKNNLTRKTDGYLPTAHFAFLDEIWKSSPAILNTLLTIINERIYRDGNKDIKVPLKGVVCASNEFPPDNQGLEALYDRMILRYFVKPL
ncbi:MAG: AAA family ATPase, partial [Campylobacter lanienae]|uniref:AAA family ATPase n=3 Tax=Campylobacter TaxID=194 RepID=UPI00242B6E2E